jgi:hypothetical protein
VHDDGYITKSDNPTEFDAGMRRVRALKRREKRIRRGVIVLGLLHFAVYLLLGVLFGWWGTGMIFVPTGGFLVFGGLAREFIVWLSER